MKGSDSQPPASRATDERGEIPIRSSPSTFDMTLSAGTRLGPYEILGLIGAGGMGESLVVEGVK